MNQDLGLRMLSEIMKWQDDRAQSEFDWLRLMARWQYDGYQDFLAGVRFIESFAAWLQQFAPCDRETAYNFVRNKLVYICASKMQRFVELFYPCIVEPRLRKIVATRLSIPTYRVWTNVHASNEFERLKRRTLFMALSEGARIDSFRHVNAGCLSNEQIVIATQVDKDKWEDMLVNLRTDLKDQSAQFAIVFLIDDFMGTGSTFLRYDDEKRECKGKLMRFGNSVTQAIDALHAKIFEENSHIYVHHYIAAYEAATTIKAKVDEAKSKISWIEAFHGPAFTFGMILPSDLPIKADPKGNEDMIKLTNTYYNPQIRTRHTDVGGATHLGLGYGGCALPLVLEHNTPNNSIALLWAETEEQCGEGIKAPAMRPLFRRRQRYS